jgi:hypothetical protein
VSTDGYGSGGSTAFIGYLSVLGWCQYALCGFMHMRTQPTTVSFFCREPYLKAIGMLFDQSRPRHVVREGLQPSGKGSLSGDFTS